MNSSPNAADPRGTMERLLGELRPKLHRYCARMTGSVVDGEDVVQEALVKALEALPRIEPLAYPEAWLFRVAHNAALDFLRRRARHSEIRAAEDLDMTEDPQTMVEDRQNAALSLHTFMRLPPAQRSSVILMDVLGYSLREIGDVMEISLPAVKAALHRGRSRLRELAQEPEDRALPILAEPERSRLAAYVAYFNARDFDALRDMLAEDVRLDLVNKLRLDGRHEVGSYFHRYDAIHDWRLVAGLVDRRPAIFVCDPDDPSAPPAYFILLQWTSDKILQIRDFRFARYAMDGAELSIVS